MRIGFIGSGKVGTSMAKYLYNNGFTISGFYSRTLDSTVSSAAFINEQCQAFSSLNKLVIDSDIIFITTSDSAITTVCNEIYSLADRGAINISGKTVSHTSGALSSEILSPLKEFGAKTASVHMLIPVNDKFSSFDKFSSAFFTIEGEDTEDVKKVLKKCGNRFIMINHEAKVKYHAAAVFASNFIVALSHQACSLLTQCGFTYDDALSALTPLIVSNTQNIISAGPQSALTGPVARGDFKTVQAHIEALDDGGERDVYIALTNALIAQTGNKPYGALADILKKKD